MMFRGGGGSGGGGTKARVMVMVGMVMVTMLVDGSPLPLKEDGDCLVEDSVEVEGQDLPVSLLAYISRSSKLDIGFFFPGLNRETDRDAVRINSTGATHTEVRGGKGPLTAIPLPRLIPEGWNTFMVEASGRSVTVTLVLGEDRLTLFTLPSLRSEVNGVLALGKVARCPTVTPTWKVPPGEEAEVVLQPAGDRAPNQWLEVGGRGWGAAAPYLVFPFTPDNRILVHENSTFRITSSVRGDHVHYWVFKKAKSGDGGGDGDEEVTSGNVSSHTPSFRVVVGGGRGGDDDSTTTTLVRLQLSPPHTKSMDKSVSSSPDYRSHFFVLLWLVVAVLVVFVVLVVLVVIDVMRGDGVLAPRLRSLLARRERRRSTRHAETEGQEGNTSLHMNGTFRGVGSEEGISGGSPSCDDPLLPYTNGTPTQRGTTHTGNISNDRCERSKKHGVKRTIQDFLSKADDGDSSAGIHNNSDRCIANGKSIVLSCGGTLSNESSQTDKAVSAELQNLLSPIFSNTQLNATLNKRSDSHWSDKDASAAFTLRSRSSKCYEYLRTKKGFPLPCKITLNEEGEEEEEDKRAKNFACEPGILYSVLFIMKSKCDSFTQLERLAVISSDEMSINSDFDVTDLTKTLMILIEEAEHAGYPVVALVHDLGPSNVKMEELGIDPVGTKKISSRNPAADQDKYVFADVPHLVKLIRNNFIDSGFYLKDGTIISDSCNREMLTATNTEYALASNVSEMHLNESGEQLRVEYATQLLSNSCSMPVEYLGQSKLLVSECFKETAGFLGMTDKWFNKINFSHKFDDKQLCNAFGVNLRDQINVLHRITETIRTMRVKNPQYKGLDMFQKGIILSSHSQIDLYNMLRESFNVEYILTRNLNQDGWNIYLGAYDKCTDPMATQMLSISNSG